MMMAMTGVNVQGSGNASKVVRDKASMSKVYEAVTHAIGFQSRFDGQPICCGSQIVTSALGCHRGEVNHGQYLNISVLDRHARSSADCPCVR